MKAAVLHAFGDPPRYEDFPESGVDLAVLHDALADGSAAAMVGEAELAGVHYGVQGTPAWRIAGRLIMGLRPAEELESLAREATQAH